jgi:hypothetical protein
MIRLTTILPCVVLHVAFIGGTSGEFRHGILRELKDLISGCTFDAAPETLRPDLEETITLSDSVYSSTSRRDNVPCCVLMRKPIDKILIRYNKIPNNFAASFETYFQEQYVSPAASSATMQRHSMASLSSSSAPEGRRRHPTANHQVLVQAATDNLATLSRYLHHKRWLWITKVPLGHSHAEEGLQDLSNILSMIMRKRLKEGFHYSYNKMGMINLTMEFEMVLGPPDLEINGAEQAFPCIIQYIIFPAQTSVTYGKE